MARAESTGRGWDLFRPIDMLASLWSSTAAIPPFSTGTAAAYRTLFLTLQRLVIGRRLSIQLERSEVTLTITEFDSQLDVSALAVGQLDEVRIAATDVRWADNRFDRATATLHNVHLRPGAPPVVIAAPVELMLEVPSSVVSNLLRWASPRLAGGVGEDAIARLGWARRPDLGHIEVDTELDGSVLWIKPRTLTVRRRRMRIPAWTPSYPVQLPELPHGLRVTEVCCTPSSLQVRGTLPEWRMDMPLAGLEDVLRQLGSVGRTTLNLTGMNRWL